MTIEIKQSLSAMPNWEANDFKTSAPYEWLYQHKDNKFLSSYARNKNTRQGRWCKKLCYTLERLF